jgi:hypothetical protein
MPVVSPLCSCCRTGLRRTAASWSTTRRRTLPSHPANISTVSKRTSTSASETASSSSSSSDSSSSGRSSDSSISSDGSSSDSSSSESSSDSSSSDSSSSDSSSSSISTQTVSRSELRWSSQNQSYSILTIRSHTEIPELFQESYIILAFRSRAYHNPELLTKVRSPSPEAVYIPELFDKYGVIIANLESFSHSRVAVIGKISSLM